MKAADLIWENDSRSDVILEETVSDRTIHMWITVCCMVIIIITGILGTYNI